MARYLLKGAAKAIGNAVGVDPLGKLRTQSASEFNQRIGGPDDVARCRCLCGPLGTESRGGGLNLGRRLLGKSTQKSGENNGIPRTSDRGGGCPDGLVEFQQVGRRIALISEAKGGAEGLADETELVDREVPGIPSALGGRMAGEARAPLGKSLADGPLTTEPQVTKGAWQGHCPRSGGWRRVRQAAIPEAHVTYKWRSDGTGNRFLPNNQLRRPGGSVEGDRFHKISEKPIAADGGIGTFCAPFRRPWTVSLGRFNSIFRLGCPRLISWSERAETSWSTRARLLPWTVTRFAAGFAFK
jgi:hypothetical protein